MENTAKNKTKHLPQLFALGSQIALNDTIFFLDKPLLRLKV